MQSFERAKYILHDVKYLLTTAPVDDISKSGWTDKLRKGKISCLFTFQSADFSCLFTFQSADFSCFLL